MELVAEVLMREEIGEGVGGCFCYG